MRRQTRKSVSGRRRLREGDVGAGRDVRLACPAVKAIAIMPPMTSVDEHALEAQRVESLAPSSAQPSIVYHSRGLVEAP